MQRVRDGSLEWLIAEYEGKERIKVANSGNGNFDEFKVHACYRAPQCADADTASQAALADERISFGFLRMISGDQVCCRVGAVYSRRSASRSLYGLQESKRVKFVFYVFVGSSANVMAKVTCPRLSTGYTCFRALNKSMIAVTRQRPQARRRQGTPPPPNVQPNPPSPLACSLISVPFLQAFGQFHVEMFADGLSDVNEQELRTKIKKSGGADYDQGSNAGGAGYQTSAHDIKAQAKGAYLSKEKETNISPVIFAKSALPQTTPIDLKGRTMVAPPSEAMRNVNHTGNLDVDKFKGKVSVVTSGGESAPAPVPAPAALAYAAESAAADAASSSEEEDAASEPPTPLLFTDRLNGRPVSLDLVANGQLLSPAQLRAQIKRSLVLIKAGARFFAQRSPFCKQLRQEAQPPLGSIFVEYPPCVRLRLMSRCVDIACQRLTTAPADMHMAHSMWVWAELVMERVTRGRVRRVQVWLQRRACCAVR